MIEAVPRIGVQPSPRPTVVALPRGRATATGDGPASSFRVSVERGVIAAIAVVGPLLLLQSMPAFVAERSLGDPLVVLSAVLAVLSCLFVPMALRGSDAAASRWLFASCIAYLLVVGLEPFEVHAVLPATYVPWLIAVSPVPVPSIAMGARNALPAVVCGILIEVGVVCAYAGRLDSDHLVIDAVVLAVFLALAIAGVRVLRLRAEEADEARRAAAERLESSLLQAALEDERLRTDALLHDSVLTTLLMTAAATGPEARARAVLMASNALEVVTATSTAPSRTGSVQPFERAIVAVEREFAPMRGLVQLDLAGAHAVVLPEEVAGTLVAAMLQAISNSIKHAGPYAARMVRATAIDETGIRITVRDDGRGFDLAEIAPERLGVRVSILERVRQVGGSAEIRSGVGRGTTVTLEWRPADRSDRLPDRSSAHR